MKQLKLIFLTLFIVILNAQEPMKIDMHGGKDTKMPSFMPTQKTNSMHEMFSTPSKKKDTNQTLKGK